MAKKLYTILFQEIQVNIKLKCSNLIPDRTQSFARSLASEMLLQTYSKHNIGIEVRAQLTVAGALDILYDRGKLTSKLILWSYK